MSALVVAETSSSNATEVTLGQFKLHQRSCDGYIDLTELATKTKTQMKNFNKLSSAQAFKAALGATLSDQERVQKLFIYAQISLNRGSIM